MDFSWFFVREDNRMHSYVEQNELVKFFEGYSKNQIPANWKYKKVFTQKATDNSVKARFQFDPKKILTEGVFQAWLSAKSDYSKIMSE